MGIVASRLWSWWFPNVECRTLMLGLDGAGKTTILYKLKLNEVVSTIPTIGFNVEVVTYQKVTLTVWDVGGQEKIRPLWKYYFPNTTALVYVVDSNDSARFDVAKEELWRLLNEYDLKDAKVLVLANKQDLPNAKKPSEIAEALNLNEATSHKWFLVATNGLKGEGLYEGLDWLRKEIAAK